MFESVLRGRGHGGPMGPVWLAALLFIQRAAIICDLHSFDDHEAMSNVFPASNAKLRQWGMREHILFKTEGVSTAFSAAFHIYIF